MLPPCSTARLQRKSAGGTVIHRPDTMIRESRNRSWEVGLLTALLLAWYLNRNMSVQNSLAAVISSSCHYRYKLNHFRHDTWWIGRTADNVTIHSSLHTSTRIGTRETSSSTWDVMDRQWKSCLLQKGTTRETVKGTMSILTDLFPVQWLLAFKGVGVWCPPKLK